MLKLKYPEQPFHVIKSTKSFQRAFALQAGTGKFDPNSSLFFIDIDCSITRETLHEIRANTIQGKQVYFPIVFSQYNPNYTTLNATVPPDIKHEFSYAKGYWRIKGYGMISTYKSDFTQAGGLNTKITGWGKKDVDFTERVLGKKTSIFRASILGLQHIFLPKKIITEVVCSKYYGN